MDPHSGRLYESLQAALADGVRNPVEMKGRDVDIRRISEAVADKALRESGSAKRRRKAIERSNYWKKEDEE